MQPVVETVFGAQALFAYAAFIIAALVTLWAYRKEQGSNGSGERGAAFEQPGLQASALPSFDIQMGGLTLNDGTLTLWLANGGAPVTEIEVTAEGHDCDFGPTNPHDPSGERRIVISSVADASAGVRFSVRYGAQKAGRWSQDYLWQLKDGEAEITPLGDPVSVRDARRVNE